MTRPSAAASRQGVVGRRSSRAREPSQLLLGDRQRHSVLPECGDRKKPSQHPDLGGHKEHLHEEVRGPAEFRGDGRQEHPVDRGLLEPEPVEIGPPDRQCLGGLERPDGSRALPTVFQQGQLPDDTARTDQPEHGGVAKLAEGPDGQPPLRHEVEGFGGVTGMKDDVALGEALAAAVGQEPTPLVVGDPGEKRPFHEGIFPSERQPKPRARGPHEDGALFRVSAGVGSVTQRASPR